MLSSLIASYAIVGIGQSRVKPDYEKLIDDLTTLGEYTAGAHPTAWGSQFIAVDEESEFGGGVLGSKEPVVHESMKKLVQAGAKALPFLFKHLDDKRETKLTITHPGGWGGMVICDEDDARFYDPKLRPHGINKFSISSEATKYIRTFTLKVGDACYIAIGQIVGRGLSVVRYQPSSFIVINSPIEMPSLAKAVRQDWEGLTEAGHRKQLEADSYNPHASGSNPYLKRLIYYYPEHGIKAAVRLLRSRMFEFWGVGDALDKMMQSADPKVWVSLESEQIAIYGKDIRFHLANQLSRRVNDIFLEGRELKNARNILKTLYPDFNRFATDFQPMMNYYDMSELVESLHSVKSAKIDEVVHAVFTNGLKAIGNPDQTTKAGRDRMRSFEGVPHACFASMKRRGFDKAYAAFFRKRVDDYAKFYPEKEQGYWVNYMKEDLKLAESSSGKI